MGESPADVVTHSFSTRRSRIGVEAIGLATAGYHLNRHGARCWGLRSVSHR